MEETPYIYSFIREDLASSATMIIQNSHACIEVALRLPDEKKPKRTSHLVLLTAKNEEKLLEIEEYLKKNGIKTWCFYEPDNQLGYTALATEPIYGKDRRLMRKFKLLK